MHHAMAPSSARLHMLMQCACTHGPCHAGAAGHVRHVHTAAKAKAVDTVHEAEEEEEEEFEGGST